MAPLLVADPPRSLRLPRVDVAARFERYRAERDPADRDALVERFLPLARHLARRYAAGPEREDVEQVAALALVRAIDRFDPARGIAFTSFAVPTILGEVKRYFRDFGWSIRVPRDLQELALRIDAVTDDLTARLGRMPTAEEIARQCGTTAERVLEARTTHSAHFAVPLDEPDGEDDDTSRGQRLGAEEPGYARAEAAADLEDLLARLPAREQTVVRLRFGCDLTQREIGERLGLSQMQISRLLRSAIAELQDAGQ